MTCFTIMFCCTMIVSAVIHHNHIDYKRRTLCDRDMLSYKLEMAKLEHQEQKMFMADSVIQNKDYKDCI